MLLKNSRKGGDTGELQKRQFDHFANMADRAYDERIEFPTLWLERLERDHDNIRSAILWASQNNPDAELRCLVPLCGSGFCMATFQKDGKNFKRIKTTL